MTPIPSLIVALCLSLTGCVSNGPKLPVSEPASSQASAAAAVNQADLTSSAPSESSTDETLFTKEFGSYTIPAGWVESESHSSKDKFFYIVDGTGDKQAPNNISVNAGANQYAADDHMSFREAIQRQLLTQISGASDTTLTGDGTYTANGYILYTFTIREEAADATTIQYYIVGDHKFVLVHETAFGDTQETDAAAKTILDSFLWAE